MLEFVVHDIVGWNAGNLASFHTWPVVRESKSLQGLSADRHYHSQVYAAGRVQTSLTEI